MDSSNLNALLATASELAMESRWREAMVICRKVVAADPSQFEAWWTLAQSYDKLNLESEARKAYGEYYARAPKRSDLQALRRFAAEQIGATFEEAVDEGEESGYPLVSWMTTINGEKGLIQARNDSGKPLEEVIDAAEKLVYSSNPFDAWVHAHRHPELYTGIADTVLSALAQAESNAGVRAGIERYRDALRRSQVEGVTPFAEIALLEPSEFMAFVTAVDDLQAAVQKLVEAENDEGRAAVLRKHPELVSDGRTLIFIRILGGLQRDARAREALQSALTLVRRVRAGRAAERRPAESRRVLDAYKQAEAAIVSGNLEEIDAALANWDAVNKSERGFKALWTKAAAQPAFVAVTRGTLLLARYGRTGDAADLERACGVLEDAMKADTDTDQLMLPYHYGVALLRRFELRGEAADLGKGIDAMRQLLGMVVDGTHAEGAARSMLGAMLMRRAELTGNASDLDAAIAAHRLALTAESDAASLAARLSNLATACVERFNFRGDVADLDEAERALDEVLEADPSNADALMGMARLLRRRYQVNPDPELLNRAIDLYGRTLDSEVAPLDRAMVLNNLSSVLRDRYLARHERADIDLAIEASTNAVEAAPPTYIHRPLWLENLGNNLRLRFLETRGRNDCDSATKAFQESIALAPEGSSVWRTAASNLAELLIETGGEEDAIPLLELTFARCLEGGVDVDLIVASRALGTAHVRRGNWVRAGEVLLAGMDAAERLQKAQQSSAAKKAWLAKAGDLHILSAEVLLRAGRVGDAVAAIERGRGRILSEALGRDRAALAELESTGDQRLVAQYRTAADQVHMLYAAAERGVETLNALVAARKSLDAVVGELRRRTGNAAFTEPFTIDDVVRASARAKAPIVYVIPLSGSGIAVIVSGSKAEVRSVMLPELSEDRVNDVVERYVGAYQEFIAAAQEQEPLVRWRAVLDETLEWSWRACMREVVTEVDGNAEVILIPVGRLGRLPLHAAAGQDRSALDAAVWRYAPNARSVSQGVPREPDRLLTVTFAGEDAPLPYTAIEAAATLRAFSNTHALVGAAATVRAVLLEARHAMVLHFACHASALGNDPLSSGLHLSDGILSMNELLDLRLAEGSLAVLSACETGVIGERLPDEVLSIASGLLQAGASAVISSLWAVPDVSTAILMSRFYFLLRDEKLAPAVALREAQRWMRDSSNAVLGAFLRTILPLELVGGLAGALESAPTESMFGHPLHWAAFTYVGQEGASAD